MTPQEKARALRPIIERAAASLDDRDASMSAELFPKLKYDGSLVEAGTRINWKGKVKKNGAALWDTEQNDPDHAPTLWADLDYRDGIRVIPETITTITQFHKDELGWWGNVLYRSKVDGNVYTPAQYAANWEIVE